MRPSRRISFRSECFALQRVFLYSAFLQVLRACTGLRFVTWRKLGPGSGTCFRTASTAFLVKLPKAVSKPGILWPIEELISSDECKKTSLGDGEGSIAKGAVRSLGDQSNLGQFVISEVQAGFCDCVHLM